MSSAGQGVDPFDPRRPFTRAQARRAGIPLRTLLGSTFHKVVWDQYVSREVPVTTKIRAQSALRLSPPGSHVSHHTAAELWGAVAPAQSCTHVTLPSVNGRLVRAGIKSHYGGPRAATTLKGLPISTPEQTFLDLASVGVELVDLVIVADGLIKQERTTTAQLMAAAGLWQGRGRPLAVRAAGLARAGVDSVQETRVRLLVVLAGLPEPKVNVIMRAEDGEWRRRYDMAYLEWKTLLEYDGRQHAEEPKQWRSDIYRREELDRMGWRLIVVTSDGVFREPDRTLERIRIALLDAGATKLPKRFRPEWERHFPRR